MTWFKKSSSVSRAAGTASGSNWYLAEAKGKGLRQVVLDIPAGSATESELVDIKIDPYYKNLRALDWAVGLFKPEPTSKPCLMLKSKDYSEYIGKASIKVAFSFFRTDHGGRAGIFVLVDSELLRNKKARPFVTFEVVYGLDAEDEDAISRIRDVASADNLRVVLADMGSDNKKTTLYDDSRFYVTDTPVCRFDINVSLEEDCRLCVRNELDALLKWDRTLSSAQRNFNLSTDAVWRAIPSDESPILPKP